MRISIIQGKGVRARESWELSLWSDDLVHFYWICMKSDKMSASSYTWLSSKYQFTYELTTSGNFLPNNLITVYFLLLYFKLECFGCVFLSSLSFSRPIALTSWWPSESFNKGNLARAQIYIQQEPLLNQRREASGGEYWSRCRPAWDFCCIMFSTFCSLVSCLF